MDEIEKAMLAGAQGFLIKPADFEEVLQNVSRFIPNADQRQASIDYAADKLSEIGGAEYTARFLMIRGIYITVCGAQYFSYTPALFPQLFNIEQRRTRQWSILYRFRSQEEVPPCLQRTKCSGA